MKAKVTCSSNPECVNKTTLEKLGCRSFFSSVWNRSLLIGESLWNHSVPVRICCCCCCSFVFPLKWPWSLTNRMLMTVMREKSLLSFVCLFVYFTFFIFFYVFLLLLHCCRIYKNTLKSTRVKLRVRSASKISRLGTNCSFFHLSRRVGWRGDLAFDGLCRPLVERGHTVRWWRGENRTE